ncbi:MAG: IPT/TIG domain-containing protein [Planctomycetota bacterium]|jgi:hypothetical protein
MFEFDSKRALGALMAALFLVAGCGGGDDAPQRLTFTVSAVVPNVSTDINGGDVVTIQGTNFLAVNIFSVAFGGSPGVIDLNTLTDTSFQATTPPAPGGNPGVVIVEVLSIDAGSKFVPGDYTYVGTSGSPQPQTITPITFTPSGAQDFTIQGTSLGPSGGNVNVSFSGVGTVQGTVSLDAMLVTGRAPVSFGTPPAAPVTVTIDTGSQTADVPTAVSYEYAGPVSLTAPWQVANGASRPVPLDSFSAIMCTSGADATWGNANDDVLIIRGPTSPTVTRVTFGGGAAIGFLDPNNSVPVVLDANTVCLCSVGPNGAFDGPATVTPDDRIILITNLQTTPAITPFVLGRALVPAPLGRISATRFAVLDAGADNNPGTADDLVQVSDTAFTMAAFPVANLDITPGRANFSIPFSPDGDSVFVMSAGLNGTPSDGDDLLTRYLVSTAGATIQPVAFAQTRPLALSASLLVAPGAGSDGAFGIAPDDLIVITATPFALNAPVMHQLPMPLDTTAVVPLAPLGTGGVVLPIQGVSPVLAFTDPVNNNSATISLTGTPLLAPLGSGDLVVFAPGASPLPGDEQAIRLLGDGSSLQNFLAMPTLNQATVVLTDADRAFGVTAAGGGALTVHQTRALGALTDTSSLPVALAPAAPILGTEPFIPVGPSWGLIQSPGMGGFASGTEAVLVVRY